MTRGQLHRTPGEQVAAAIDLANKLYPGKNWILAKGTVRPGEPLYGFFVFEPGDEDTALAQGEHDDPVECVMSALDQKRFSGGTA